MHINSVIDIGRIIKVARQEKGWSQTVLAGKIGTSQRWISEIEKGKPRAELALVLACINALGVHLEGAIKTESLHTHNENSMEETHNISQKELIASLLKTVKKGNE